jgi:hypothetical protein
VAATNIVPQPGGLGSREQKGHMHFRLTYEIRGYSIPLKDDPLVIHIGGPRNLVVQLTHTVSEALASDQAAGYLQAFAETDPPPKAATSLREMLPAGTDPELHQVAGQTSPPIENRPAGYDALPGPLKVFSDKIYDVLADAAVDVFALIRWQHALPGPVRPYTSHGLEWSEDEASWHRLPHKITFHISAAVHRRLHTGDALAIESMTAAGTQEPLAHILLREARASATVTGSYSSALVMGMAALEIGVKHLIAELVPNASWLALQAPTPPIIAILTDYLPTLPARLDLGDNALKLPSGLIDTLRKGVTARNTAVHSGKSQPSKEFVERVLNSVSDSLWIFDYYAGRAWALDNLSIETKNALKSLTNSAG